MGALLPVIMAISVLASLLGLYNSQVGTGNIQAVLADKQLIWSYQAAMVGLKEAVTSPIATNRLNFINGAIDPYNPASGLVKNTAGNTVAMYRYVALGGDPHRTELGAYDPTRLGNLTSLQPRYVAVVGTSCVNPSNHQAIASALTINYANGTLSCSSGDEQNVTVFAKVSMGTLVSSAVGNNPIQWVRVWAGTNDALSTEGPRIWVPDYGLTRAFDFSRAWQGGTSNTPGMKAADLYKVFVYSGATALSSTWTAYDALGESDLSIPEASYASTLSETPTIKFVFSGPMYFPSLYPSGQVVAAPPNVNYGGCFSDANTATQCNIYAQKENDASPNVELEVYPVLPAGTQVMTYGSLPEYTNSSGAASDNLYSINMDAGTVYDAWGNSATAFQAHFKVGEVTTGGGTCSVAESVTISANNTTQSFTDTTKVYTVTIATGVDNTTLTFNNGCGNTATINSITSDETNITVTTGTLGLNLPATSNSYTTAVGPPKHYDLDCGDHDVYVTGVHTPSYGGYDCDAGTCSTPEAVSISSNGTNWTGSDTSKIYTVTVAGGVDNSSLTFNNGCSNTATIVSTTSDETTINVSSGSLTLNLPALMASYTISGAAPTHYQLNCDAHDVYVTGVHTPAYGSFDCTPICPTYNPLPSNSASPSPGTPTFITGSYSTRSLLYENGSLITLGDGDASSDIELVYFPLTVTGGETVFPGTYTHAGLMCPSTYGGLTITQCENSWPSLTLYDHYTGCEYYSLVDMGMHYVSPNRYYNYTRLRFADTFVTLTGYDHRTISLGGGNYRLEYCYKFQRSDTGAIDCTYPDV